MVDWGGLMRNWTSHSFLFLHLWQTICCLHRLGRWWFSTKSVALVSSQMLPALQSAAGRKGREQMRPDDLIVLMVCDCQPHWWDFYSKTSFSLPPHLHINNSFPWNIIFCLYTLFILSSSKLDITHLKAQNLTLFSFRWMRVTDNLHSSCILPLIENDENL